MPYDVVIIGAGPAGAQCARDLSTANIKILLLEKNKDFHTNNYSSGGAPLSMMKDYDLPDSIVGSFWDTLQIATSNDSHTWKSPSLEGVVCDFMKLRQFLALEAEKRQTEIRLHTTYLQHENRDNSIAVHIKNLDTQKTETIETKVLVDATGVERKVLMQGVPDHAKTIAATGIEHLIESSSTDYQKYAGSLNFYFGHRWMPQGYAWIFPMEPNLLKIGIIRYFPHDKYMPYETSYTFYLNKFIEEQLSMPPLNVLDKHGKTLYYLKGQKDIRYSGRVISIGDAISTLNPLACEGIRHALFSGKAASKHILEFLSGNKQAFHYYDKDMKKYFGFKWLASELLTNQIYQQKNDKKYDQMLETFKKFTMQEMLAFSFDYKLSKMFKLFFNYTCRNFKLYNKS